MKNVFKVFLLPLFFIGLTPLCAQADPPLPPFYEAVIKMSPEGKLGQILKQKKLKHLSRAHKHGELLIFPLMLVSVRPLPPVLL